MKAVQINTYGGSEVLGVHENIPTPIPGKGQVLIEVHAAGLNPFDIKVLSGAYKEMIPLKFPVTFGGDFSGVLTQVGEGVSDFQIGDEVYGTAIVLSGGSGAFAQMTVANTQKVAYKPKKVSFTEAAALPVAGLTAVEAITDQIKIQKDQRILIHGGAGGVGHMAIQYAKSVGAHVITTVSGDDIEYAKSLGADEVIDYKTQAFENNLQNLDAVLDTAGGQVSEKSYQVLKKGGILVLLVSQVDEELAQKYAVTAIRQQSKTDAPQLRRLSELVDGGKIKVHVDKSFPLDQVKEAFIHLKAGHPRGKVVISVANFNAPRG